MPPLFTVKTGGLSSHCTGSTTGSCIVWPSGTVQELGALAPGTHEIVEPESGASEAQGSNR